MFTLTEEVQESLAKPKEARIIRYVDALREAFELEMQLKHTIS